MDVQPIQATAQSAPGVVPASETQGAAAISSDFNTFLQMLTVQMQNQDPLNPIESSDYAVQLATFSQVEQQVETNELLRALASSGSYGGLADHAAWVGMEARTSGLVTFSGSAQELHVDIPLNAASAELVVSSVSGQELHRKPITGDAPYAWDGRSPAGTELLHGDYALSVETRTVAGQTETLPVGTFARITEVRNSADGPQVVLEGGSVLSASEVEALRGG